MGGPPGSTGSTVMDMKQFGTVFNQVAEECFRRCVYSVNGATLEPQEGICVDGCINKNFNAQTRTMLLFLKDKAGQDNMQPAS